MRKLRQRTRRGPRLIDGNDLAVTIVEDGARVAAENVRADFQYAVSRCESPIERIFIAQFLHPQWRRDYSFSSGDMHFEVLNPMYDRLAERGDHATPPPCEGVYIFPQYPFGDFRVDFLIWPMLDLEVHPSFKRVIVECDGHEFHEKTKEQVRRDKTRERLLVSTGVPVMRFAGSEIYADSAACVQQVLDFAFGLE